MKIVVTIVDNCLVYYREDNGTPFGRVISFATLKADDRERLERGRAEAKSVGDVRAFGNDVYGPKIAALVL